MKQTASIEGSPDRPLIVLGEAPSFQEIKQKKPFVGPSGEVFNDCLRTAGLSRRLCYVINVWPFPVARDRSGTIFSKMDMTILWSKSTGLTSHGLAAAKPTLDLIKAASADTILALGAIPLELCMADKRPIMKWRGSIMRGHERVGNRRVIATPHPAATIHGAYLWRYLIINDMERVRGEMGTGYDLNLPVRNIIIPKSVGEVRAYIEKCRSIGRLATDLEVINHQVSCFSLCHDPSEAMVVPLHYENGEPYWTIEEECQIWLAYASIMSDEKVMKINQNIVGFDAPFLLRQNKIFTCGPIGDTMIAQHIMYPEFNKGLDFIASVHTREPYFKDEGKMWKGLGGDIETFWTYNGKDACVALESWYVLAQEMTDDGYWDTYNMTVQMMNPLMFMAIKGIGVDHEELAKTKERVSKKIDELEAELNNVADYPFNPNSPKQVKAYFYEHKGITPYKNANGGVTTDDKAMARIVRKSNLREARLVQEIRAIKKLKGTYLDMGFDPDGRLRSSWNPRGTWTGRLSSSQTVFDTGANLQNLHPAFNHFLVADK